MRIAPCLLAAWMTSVVVAEEHDGLGESEKGFITSSVNLLGDCMGFYEFMSEVFKSDDKPATGQQMHELANGAMMAASYLLYLEHNASGQESKPLGAFKHYPQGRADANKTRLIALVEQKDLAGLAAEQKRCLASIPMQNELVQKIRDESVGRQ